MFFRAYGRGRGIWQGGGNKAELHKARDFWDDYNTKLAILEIKSHFTYGELNIHWCTVNYQNITTSIVGSFVLQVKVID